MHENKNFPTKGGIKLTYPLLVSVYYFQLSMADIAVFDFLDYIKTILKFDVKDQKILEEFYDKVAANEGIAKHLQNRPVTKS